MPKKARSPQRRKSSSPTRKKQGVSMGALAKALDRSARYLRQLRKRGKFSTLPDGTYDVEQVRQDLKKNIDPLKSSREEITEASDDIIADENDAREAVSMIARVLKSEGRKVSGALTFNDVRTAEIILKARERDLTIQKMQGLLVPKRAILKHVEEAFANYRKELQALPARYGAEMAAELGVKVSALDKELTRIIHEHLNDLSGPVVNK